MKANKELLNEPNLLISKMTENGGCGEIFKFSKRFCSVIWSNGGGWEHVSIAPYKRSYVPSWADMCNLKNMFFKNDEVAVQYHPAKDEYVNNVSNCLHLWRPINTKLPTPPPILVGIKKGQTKTDVSKVIKSFYEPTLADIREDFYQQIYGMFSDEPNNYKANQIIGLFE